MLDLLALLVRVKLLTMEANESLFHIRLIVASNSQDRGILFQTTLIQESYPQVVVASVNIGTAELLPGREQQLVAQTLGLASSNGPPIIYKTTYFFFLSQ